MYIIYEAYVWIRFVESRPLFPAGFIHSILPCCRSSPRLVYLHKNLSPFKFNSCLSEPLCGNNCTTDSHPVTNDEETLKKKLKLHFFTHFVTCAYCLKYTCRVFTSKLDCRIFVCFTAILKFVNSNGNFSLLLFS